MMQFRADLPLIVDAIVDALQEISEWRESESSSKAKTLIAGLCSRESIASLVRISEVLSVTVKLSQYLQKETITVDKASFVVQSTISILKEKRDNTEAEFATIFAKMNTTARLIGVGKSLCHV